MDPHLELPLLAVQLFAIACNLSVKCSNLRLVCNSIIVNFIMVAFLVALGDANVPVQADGVPPALLKKLQPGKISGFLGLGNVGPCVVKVLKRIQAEMRLVRGNSEDEAHLPATQVCSSAHRHCSVLSAAPLPIRCHLVLEDACGSAVISCASYLAGNYHVAMQHFPTAGPSVDATFPDCCRCSRLRECE